MKNNVIAINQTPAFRGALVKHNNEFCMSSRDIAAYTGKAHCDVLRDIRNMFSVLMVDVSKFAVIYKDSMNRQQTEYMLNETDSHILVSGYDIQLRAVIVREWMALKAQQRNPLDCIPNFEDPIAACDGWKLQYTARVKAETEIKALEVESHDKSINADKMKYFLNTTSHLTIRRCFEWAIGAGYLHQHWNGNKPNGYTITASGEKYFTKSTGNSKRKDVLVLPAFREVCPARYYPANMAA